MPPHGAIRGRSGNPPSGPAAPPNGGDMDDETTTETDDETTEAVEAVLSDEEGEEAEEVEEDAEGAQGPTEGQDEASAPAGETLEELEAKRAKLARSATTWRNRVSDVLGEEAQYLEPCELCEPDIPGFHFPAELMQATDDMHGRLIAVLQQQTGPEYPEAPDVRRCDACAGYGSVSTGSRVAGRETKVCTACAGYGYVPPPTLERNNGAAGAGQAGELVAVGASPGLLEDADAWGSPRLLPDGRDNPNYGKMPQYKDAALP